MLRRYCVTLDFGRISVIGKTFSSSCLLPEEVAAVIHHLPSSKLDDAVVYNRVLCHGVFYTSRAYERQVKQNDHILCFKAGSSQKEFGDATHYVSTCTANCTCSKPCQHLVVVNRLNINQQCNLSRDSVTGATAQHVHYVNTTR